MFCTGSNRLIPRRRQTWSAAGSTLRRLKDVLPLVPGEVLRVFRDCIPPAIRQERVQMSFASTRELVPGRTSPRTLALVYNRLAYEPPDGLEFRL